MVRGMVVAGVMEGGVLRSSEGLPVDLLRLGGLDK